MTDVVRQGALRFAAYEGGSFSLSERESESPRLWISRDSWPPRIDSLRRRNQLTISGCCSSPDLWRRMVFSVLISNTDGHLRNHGFLYSGGSGWRLSPAYDLNPVPVDVHPRVLSTPIAIDLAMDVTEYFDLTLVRARSQLTSRAPPADGVTSRRSSGFVARKSTAWNPHSSMQT